MKRILLFLALTLAPIHSFAATCFWVSGTGNWNDTAHWKSTSGGAGACAATDGYPHTGSDSATLDGSSGGGTVTMNVSVNTTGAFDMGAFTGTVADAGNNQTFGTCTISGSGVRTVNFTAAEWDCTGNSNPWSAFTVSNLTVTSLPTLIKLTGAVSPTLNSGGLTYNDISFTGSGATAVISGAGTMRDLTVSIGTGSFSFGVGATFSLRNATITAGTCVSNAQTHNISGNLTVNASTSCIIGGTVTLNGTSGTQTITTNGMSGNTSNWIVNNSGTAVVFDSLTTSGTFTNTAGTTSFSGAFSGGAVTLTAGSLTFNGTMTSSGAFSYTAGTLVLNNTGSSTTFTIGTTNTRAFTLKRKWSITGTGTVFSVTNVTGLTVACAPDGHFAFTDTSASSKTVVFQGSEILKCIKYTSGSDTHGWTVTP